MQYLKYNLKKILKDKKITQRELAQKIGYSEIQISKIMNGGNPSMGLLEKICIELNVTLIDLLKKPEL